MFTDLGNSGPNTGSSPVVSLRYPTRAGKYINISGGHKIMIFCWNNNLEMFCYKLSEVHELKNTLSSIELEYIPASSYEFSVSRSATQTRIINGLNHSMHIHASFHWYVSNTFHVPLPVLIYLDLPHSSL